MGRPREEAVAIIGGTGVYQAERLENAATEQVRTKYGIVELTVGQWKGRTVYFLPRHGRGHSIPPHRINYRANLAALAEQGVTQILATSAVGSLRSDWPAGRLVVLDQFIDFTSRREATFYDGEDDRVVHTDMTNPYCSRLREIILKTAVDLGLDIAGSGCYVCTDGPRFETAAEVRAFGRLGGDVVGMTGVPEVTLARELGLCYAAVALVTNLGAGLSTTPLAHDEVIRQMQENADRLQSLLWESVARLPLVRPSTCCQQVGA